MISMRSSYRAAPLNADTLRTVPQALEFVKDFDEKDKPMAIICHAPWMLASGEPVKGRNPLPVTTPSRMISATLVVHWLDEAAVRDHNWVHEP